MRTSAHRRLGVARTEWPENATRDLSDDHFDDEEDGIDPALLADAKEKALQHLEEFGAYEIVPREQTKVTYVPSGWTLASLSPGR
jgi:hypothetical protein